jgi:uncharacterized protein YbaR (Trm112 family)
MHCRIAELLACPVCSAPLSFIGTIRDNRYVNGHFKCRSKHIFQVKEQIGVLKDAKQSEREFEWKINVVFDDTPLTEEENQQAEAMLKSLWLGQCVLPDEDEPPAHKPPVESNPEGKDCVFTLKR